MGLNVDDRGRPWTNSGGGPIVVLPAELAEHWRGTLPPVSAAVPPGWTWGDAGGPECDYDRACKPPIHEGTGYGGFGWVDVQGHPILVVDAEIPTFFEATPDGGFLVRATIDEEDGDLNPANVAADAWHTVGTAVLTLADGRLYMFDAAGTGALDSAQIQANDGVGVITLGAGRWHVDFATNPDEVDFVRFRRIE